MFKGHKPYNEAKKNTLKSISLDVRQTVFYAYTFKFGFMSRDLKSS